MLPLRMVMMGVAGSGKSTVGAALAPEIDGVYIDGDDLHPQSNIDKMASGIPLNDDDRAPWLALVGQRLAHIDAPTIIGCSALKRTYRETIRKNATSDPTFIHLTGSRQVIEDRMSKREGHFMPMSLIDSQFATLEPPGPDELSISVDIDQEPGALVAEIIEKLETTAH